MPEHGLNDRIEVELLKKDVAMITRLCEKMDTTIEKVQQVAADLTRIVSVHESKFTDQDKSNAELEKNVDQNKKDNASDIKELHEKIDRVNNDLRAKIAQTEGTILAEIQKLKTDINELSSWRYMIMGGVALFVFLFTKGADIIKFFKG